ncbi:hypothetical protein [Gordonia sp. NPDC058843]|uniref:hypothetical protein n=1 Tax=Gordonia sp. NPDC058843 TaxID=3346648 RepID=UPI00369E8D04
MGDEITLGDDTMRPLRTNLGFVLTIAAAALPLTIACVDTGIEPVAVTTATVPRAPQATTVDGPPPPVRIAVETPPEIVRPRIDPWPLPDDSALRPDQRRAVEILGDLSTGSDGERLAQRSTCRVLRDIKAPPADALGWRVRVVTTVTMQHGRALLAAPQQRIADDSVIVLARILAEIDAAAGPPYRPVFVHGCSPY